MSMHQFFLLGEINRPGLRAKILEDLLLFYLLYQQFCLFLRKILPPLFNCRKKSIGLITQSETQFSRIQLSAIKKKTVKLMNISSEAHF